MKFLTIVLGLVVLVLGRKLFWLSVAIVGFLLGMEFSSMILADQPQWVMILIGLGSGLLGALLAIVAQRVAFSLAGLYAGAYLALFVGQSLGAEVNSMLLLVVGGIIGAILAAFIMDWAIIALSCLVGAGAIVGAAGLGPTMSTTLFSLLVIGGILVQARLGARSRKH